MSAKTILITDPADSILRKLATRFLQKPQESPQESSKIRVVCFSTAGADREAHPLQELTLSDGGLQFTGCDRVPVDELWHAKNPGHSLEESRTMAERVLSFVRKENTSVINYVSTLYAAGIKDGLAVEQAIDAS